MTEVPQEIKINGTHTTEMALGFRQAKEEELGQLAPRRELREKTRLENPSGGPQAY